MPPVDSASRFRQVLGSQLRRSDSSCDAPLSLLCREVTTCLRTGEGARIPLYMAREGSHGDGGNSIEYSSSELVKVRKEKKRAYVNVETANMDRKEL